MCRKLKRNVAHVRENSPEKSSLAEILLSLPYCTIHYHFTYLLLLVEEFNYSLSGHWLMQLFVFGSIAYFKEWKTLICVNSTRNIGRMYLRFSQCAQPFPYNNHSFPVKCLNSQGNKCLNIFLSSQRFPVS